MKIEIPEKKKLVYEMRIPIRWGDMDAKNHVNNTSYFRYLARDLSDRLAEFHRLWFLGSEPKFAPPAGGLCECDARRRSVDLGFCQIGV